MNIKTILVQMMVSKYELISMDAVRKMANILYASGADFVVEGTAIITDHIFSDSSMIREISEIHPDEDFTETDWEAWSHAKRHHLCD